MPRVGFKSHKGMKRESNEDSCFILPQEGVFIVADGVGGHNSGQTASGMAVSEIAEMIKQKPIRKRKENSILKYLESCVEAANIRIIHRAIEAPENVGMATTLVMCYINGNKAYFANAGDSRAYIFRDGELRQITEDHSYVNLLVKKGAITKEDAINHEESNKITKALGVEYPVKADYYIEKLRKNDVLLLCTDGLYNEVDENEICDLIKHEKDMSKLAEQFLSRANAHGGKDNITVVCLKIEGGFQNG